MRGSTQSNSSFSMGSHKITHTKTLMLASNDALDRLRSIGNDGLNSR